MRFIGLTLIAGLVALHLHVTQGYTIWNSGDGNLHRLNVVQDVLLERPGTNFNSDPTLIVGLLRGYPKKRTLVQFQNLRKSKCPVKKIRWAKMYLYYIYSHKASWYSVAQAPFISRPIQVHTVLKRWDEKIATSRWRLRGTRWSQQWLALNGVDAESSPQDCPTAIYTSRPSSFVEFDVTSAVRGWAEGKPNYGLVLWATDENKIGRGTRFASNANKNRRTHAFVNVMCDY